MNRPTVHRASLATADEWLTFPTSRRRGGCAIKKTSRSFLSSRRRGGVQPQRNSAEFDHHPVRSITEASRYFVEVASTPPRRGGENCGTLRFGNNPYQLCEVLTPLCG